MASLISAAGLEVESIWPKIFAKALVGKNVSDMITNVGSAAPPAAAVGGSAPAAAGGAAAKVEKKEEKKVEKEAEESDDDMGFGLFD